MHNINTRPNAKLSCFQKSTIYTGIKTFNSYNIALQSSRMARQNSKQPSKKYLNPHSYYSVHEFFFKRKDDIEYLKCLWYFTM